MILEIEGWIRFQYFISLKVLAFISLSEERGLFGSEVVKFAFRKLISVLGLNRIQNRFTFDKLTPIS